MHANIHLQRKLIKLYARKAKTVYADDGVAELTVTREAAVVHEAAHAVVQTHDGDLITVVSVFSRPFKGKIAWGGVAKKGRQCDEMTSPERDLRQARAVIAGKVAEQFCTAKCEASSLDEIMLSQTLAKIASCKLDRKTAGEQLWRKQVWQRAEAILWHNQKVFYELSERLHREGSIKGAELKRLLSGVRRLPPLKIPRGPLGQRLKRIKSSKLRPRYQRDTTKTVGLRFKGASGLIFV